MPQLLLNCKGRLELRLPKKPTSIAPSTVLETNNPVLESQIPAVRHFLRHARARKSRVDEKIASLELSLEDLYAESNELDTQIFQHQGAISPLRRIPPEIISEIFSLALSPDEGDWHLQESAPWILGAVCARWRAISLSPVFWTEISNWTGQFSLHKLTTLLDRSKSLPLRIYFDCVDGGRMTSLEKESLKLLVQHCARWERVTLRGGQKLYTRMQHLGPQFPLLQALVFDVCFVDKPATSSALDLFRQAPRLENATVNMGFYTDPVVLAFPWGQISKYRASIEWRTLGVLADAANLVDCVLDLGYGHKPDGRDIPVVLLPCLVRLAVSHCELVAYLKTPMLRELYCHDFGANYQLRNLGFFRSLPRTLTKLVMACTWPSLELGLVGLIEALPQLQHFATPQLFDGHVVCDFLQTAEFQRSALESLVVSIGDFSNEFLLDALGAVDWESVRLRTLRLASIYRAPQDKDTRLKALRDRGVKVDFLVAFPHDGHRRVVPEFFRIAH
ncbi:hypothetical protein FB45DRAFT_921794 [Roridomyces roridus]|uniref:F-box domain-containing protein n=1 Tax=Roridomyces roridus TaxID=1738132 RepID=A0AAD7FKP6_9AGAR|nr:hypothetical protein FB45DRAFT_921794 [Roridomyces roridus]